MKYNKIHTAFELVKRDRRQLLMSLFEKFRWLFTNEMFIKLRFRIMMGYRLDLSNPKTFCEKIQWLKLYNHVNEYHTLVDKCTVKALVAERVGSKYIIPTYATFDKYEDFCIDQLPDQFVVKSNNGGGGEVIVCLEKKSLNIDRVKRLFLGMHSLNIYRQYGEWAYKGMVPKVLVEKALVENDRPGKPLTDYKFFCFNGEPKFCQVIKGRDSHETIDFFDMEWNHQPFIGLNSKATNSVVAIDKPINFAEMIYISRVLSANIPFVRIDLYEVVGSVYFGEITFYPASGIGVFTPVEYDKILGDLIQLPLKKL